MNHEIRKWLRVQLAKAEKALRCREDMAKVWAEGTTESWRKAGCKKSTAQRLRESEIHKRIAVKCRDDVKMFKAVIRAIEGHL